VLPVSDNGVHSKSGTRLLDAQVRACEYEELSRHLFVSAKGRTFRVNREFYARDFSRQPANEQYLHLDVAITRGCCYRLALHCKSAIGLASATIDMLGVQINFLLFQ
jgi:hypothetical protein